MRKKAKPEVNKEILKSLIGLSDERIKTLATEINESSATIRKWLKSPSSIPAVGLSKLAFYYGLSSKELKEAINGEVSILTSSEPCASIPYLDAWWGHVGVRFREENRSKWFPITLKTAEFLPTALRSIESPNDWLMIETLTNRVLFIRPSSLNRISILDDNAAQPEDDWNIFENDYYGRSEEFYKGLEQYYMEALGFYEQDDICDDVKEAVETYTDVYDLDLDMVGEMIHHSQVYDLLGRRTSLDINDSQMIKIFSDIEYGLSPLIFDFTNDNIEIFMSSDNVSLIDMPKRRLYLAYEELLKLDSIDEN